MKIFTSNVRKQNPLQWIVFVLALLTTSCTTKIKGLELEFVMQNGDDINRTSYVFSNNEVSVLDWDSQIFKLNNYEKVASINSYLRYNPAVKSYIAVSVDGQHLYDVSIIAISSSTSFCSLCPKLFVNKGNNILNADFTLNIVEGIPSVADKYRIIKEEYHRSFQ